MTNHEDVQPGGAAVGGKVKMVKGNQSKTAKERTAEFLRRAPAASLEMLRVFAEAEADESGSFASVAQRLGIKPRTVTRNLGDLNDLFQELSEGGQLLHRVKVNYELTDAGRLIGQDLMVQHRRLGDTVMRAASKHTEAWIPVTSNCIADLQRLQMRMRNKDIRLYPEPHRSADLLPPMFQGREQARVQPKTFPYAMYSMCTDVSELTERSVGTIGGIEPAEVMVLRIEPFQVLAETRTFPSPRPLKLADVWDFCELVVPDGGAVRTFLTQMAGAWEPVRNYLEGTDLDCCLSCLRHHSVPEPAMIVHGYTGPPPDGFALFDISDETNLAAVTGIFHRPELSSALGAKKGQLWKTIWMAAQEEYAFDDSAKGVA